MTCRDPPAILPRTAGQDAGKVVLGGLTGMMEARDTGYKSVVRSVHFAWKSAMAVPSPMLRTGERQGEDVGNDADLCPETCGDLCAAASPAGSHH